jgi:hypothetical protein
VRLTGVQAPWCVVAGWAIDLFLGGERREHDDLDVAVPARRFGEVAAGLPGLEPFVPGVENGRELAWPLEEAGGREETHHQTWFREPATGAWRIDVFREPHAGDTWICRRDERIRLPYRELILRTEAGIPYARPEVVLLFKAKHARPKDEDDLDATLPRLDATSRERLAGWLELVHPGHAWIERVRGG